MNVSYLVARAGTSPPGQGGKEGEGGDGGGGGEEDRACFQGGAGGLGRAGGLGAGRGVRGPAPCLPGVLATGGRAGGAWGAVRAPSRALRVSEARGRLRPAGAGVFAAVRVGGETGVALGPRFWPSPRLPLLSSGPRCAPSPCLSRARPALPPRGHPAPARAPRSAAAPRAPARPGRTLVSRPPSLPPPRLQLCLSPGAVLAAALPPPLPARPGKPASRSGAFRPSRGRLLPSSRVFTRAEFAWIQGAVPGSSETDFSVGLTA